MKHSTFAALTCALLANIGCAVACGPKPLPPRQLDLPLRKREGRCGPGVGRCPSGQCCSEGGYCGNDPDYCGGSQCQLDYSDACDTFFGPPGPSTENIARPKIGSVPYGSLIQECTRPGLMALTFDDGPYYYTDDILDRLDDLEVPATFFLAGNNRAKGRIDDEDNGWAPMVRRIHAAGHHIGSHTWTHRDLDAVNASVRRTELIYNEMVIRNILGFFPTYARAPFLSCTRSTGCLGLFGELGYHVTDINVDTKDFEFDDPALIQNAKDRFDALVSRDAASNSYIVLAHDVQRQTVTNLTQYMVETARDRGYRLVTLGECLGDPRDNWYRVAPRGGGSEPNPNPNPEPESPSTTTTSISASSSTSTSATRAAPTPTTSGIVISRDQKCGGNTGQTCSGSKFGNCCSAYGFCGSSATYCGTGCDTDFGACNPRDPGVQDTTNGLCGKQFMATCANFGSKTCCSAFGFCGSESAHCGSGCQKGFGRCD
jgi:peptidoglycan/xylan/chitin deacetylase (PgdA/CDA1 family)